MPIQHQIGVGLEGPENPKKEKLPATMQDCYTDILYLQSQLIKKIVAIYILHTLNK